MTHLFERFYEPCVLLEQERTMSEEGGWVTEYRDGAEFSAAIVQNSSESASVADAKEALSSYSIYAEDGVTLKFHDIVKRKSDGLTFMIVSEPIRTPSDASFYFTKASAESWEVPE